VTIHLPSIVRGSPLDLAEHLPGRSFQDIRRRGKLIIMSLSGGLSLLSHLRMTGQLLYLPVAAPMEKHTHLVFHLDDGHHLRYRDQRQFGWIQLAETDLLAEHPQVAQLGPEPLEIPQDEFVSIIQSRRRQIKPLLMDQSALAGMGNIYIDESLFRARIHPLRRASDLSRAKLRALHGAIQEVLAEAIDCAGSTVGQYRGADGQSGEFQRFLRVYGHQGDPCVRCGRPVVKIRVGSRGTHICRRCQRAPKN
jgi:formamidopyrimidine-DNA glycosylase